MNISKVEKNDLNYICYNSNVNLLKFSGKTILVTGATGMIGREIVLSILTYNNYIDKPTIIAIVRNLSKAKKIFGEENSNIKYVVSDITMIKEINYDVDYIIHCASLTASIDFLKRPVDVSKTMINGTINMLELAVQKNVDGFVYLSSMETYGTPQNDNLIMENSGCNIDTMNVRSCYPEAKRMCESLCSSYHAQFGVPVTVGCLTQTFGPGVSYNDTRVFAEFARCAIEGKDIVLHTPGNTKRNYLYLSDAVTAIFTLLLNGKSGEKYNIANSKIYCSIKDMALIVAKNITNDKINVIVETCPVDRYWYAPELHMNLNTEKIKKLGWNPHMDLKEMYFNLCEDMKSSKNL